MSVVEKKCNKCDTIKQIEEFVRGKNCCKECNREACKLYKANNRQKIAEYNKEYKQEHKEELSDYNAAYHQEHKERVYERHAVNVRKYKEKKKTDDNFKQMENIRKTIRTFTKGETKTNKYIGCSRDFLLKWVEYHDPSYTLDTYGLNGWCLDHVLPCIKFKVEEADKCFHWSNTRPLTIKENSKKHRYLNKEELDKHLQKVKEFTEREEIKALILKENIIIPEFDRYAYLDTSV
jgi:hypothetical protein